MCFSPVLALPNKHHETHIAFPNYGQKKKLVISKILTPLFSRQKCIVICRHDCKIKNGHCFCTLKDIMR